MDIDKKLELLKKIQKVDAPAFLLTRVLARVQSPERMPAPASWRLAFIAASTVVLILNVSILFKSAGKQNEKNIEEIAASLELSNTNDLYND